MPSQVVLVVKDPPLKAGKVRDTNLIPGLGRCPGGRHGNPLQYSCLETLMDRGGWCATAHGVTKNRTQLSDLVCTHIMPIRMYREIKIKSFGFLKHKIKLGIWHWFSWIRTYLHSGGFHHRKSPQWKCTDAVLLAEYEGTYARRSLNAAPSHRLKLTSHVKTGVHPHVITLRGGPQAWESPCGRSKLKLGNGYNFFQWVEANPSTFSKSTRFPGPTPLPVLEFVLHLETAVPCLACSPPHSGRILLFTSKMQI